VAGVNQTLSLPLGVTYIQKNQNSFSQEFIAALARGTGPDAILLPVDMLLSHLDKITPIPYEALPARTFMDSYINEAQIYATESGILGIPFVVDPLIMYWNKDSFASAGLATYPRYWDEFGPLNKTLTSLDQNGNIRRSAMAMGDFTNVANARELLGTLLLQAGNTITTQNADGTIESALSTNARVDPSPAVRFFTQFVNPSDANYSWNRGMPNSKTAFLSGALATYFGFASELKDIRAKNPNLNFDAAPIPQLRSGGIKATYGRLYGLSIVRSSPNQNAAYQTFAVLANSTNLSALSQLTYLPSVSLSLIGSGSSDPYLSIFNQAVLVAKTWLDADQTRSYQILGNMVGSITSGAKTVAEAVNDAGEEYDVALRQATQ